MDNFNFRANFLEDKFYSSFVIYFYPRGTPFRFHCTTFLDLPCIIVGFIYDISWKQPSQMRNQVPSVPFDMPILRSNVFPLYWSSENYRLYANPFIIRCNDERDDCTSYYVSSRIFFGHRNFSLFLSREIPVLLRRTRDIVNITGWSDAQLDASSLSDHAFYIIGGLICLTGGITSEAICARAKFNMTAETINLRDRPAAWLPDETLGLSYSTYRPT